MQDLNDSMQSHLRLHFNNEEASDEQVRLPIHSPMQEKGFSPRLDWRMVFRAGGLQVRRFAEQTCHKLLEVVNGADSTA